jgi:hypothetical protein
MHAASVTCGYRLHGIRLLGGVAWQDAHGVPDQA